MLQTALHLELNSLAQQGGVMSTYWSTVSSNCDCNEVRVLLT